MNHRHLILISVGISLMALGCSKVGFTTPEETQDAFSVSPGPLPSSAPSPSPSLSPTPAPSVSPPVSPAPPATPLPSPAPSPSPSMAPPTPTPSPSAFNPGQTGNFSCENYVALTIPAQGHLAIPARDQSGTCYTLKLLSPTSYVPSSANPNIDDDVISRDHDVPGYTSFDTHHPYLLGKSSLTLYMEGARSITLAGAANAQTPIQVDNFILVGIMPPNASNIPQYYQAYGTSDSTIDDTPDISFLNEPVPLTPFASGGTSTITPLSLSGQMSTFEDYNLDVRAEDCGWVGNNSSIYLVFQ